MRPTTEWMQAKYDEMNRLLFNGRLGDCILRPFTSGKGASGRTLGWFKITNMNVKYEGSSRRMFVRNPNNILERIYVNRGNFVDTCKPCIELNANYTWSENAMVTTLVHEMCHYYTYMNGLVPLQGHGREFREIGQLVSARSNGMITIQRLASAEQKSEMTLDADIKAKNDARLANKKSKISAIIVKKRDNTYNLTTTSSDAVINTILSYAKPRGYKFVLKSNDSNFIDLLFSKGYNKNMRTYRFWDITNKDFVNGLDNYETEVLYGSMNEKVDIIVNNILSKLLKEEDLENDVMDIDPTMNLGLASPIEMLG